MSSQEKPFYESIEVKEKQGDTTDTQFAFPKQCLVLGDPRVGKTSLINALTGKPFDLAVQKTQGINQSLVDHEWKNCDMIDLVFGDLWRYLKTGDVEVTLIGTGGRNNKVLVGDLEFLMTTGLLRLFLYSMVIGVTCMFLVRTLFRYPAAYLLFYFIYFGHLMFPICAIHFETSSNIRFILTTLAFILNRRGLLIGLYSAIMICPFYNSFLTFASTGEFLTLSSVTGIAFIIMFLFIGPLRPPFGTAQLIGNRNFMKFLCFCRLPLSFSIGLISGFTVAMSFGSWYDMCLKEAGLSVKLSELSKTVYTPDMTGRKAFNYLRTCLQSSDQVVITFLATFIFEFPAHIFDLTQFRTFSLFKTTNELGSKGLSLFFLFYYFKIAFQVWNDPPLTVYYFCISFSLYIFLTLYQEWFCSHSESNERVIFYPSNSFLTLALTGSGEVNTKKLRTALKDKYPSLKLKVLDFAGDKEYYAYHHMFLKSHAVYLIVFNMADFTEDEKKDLCNEKLQFWIESVCTHVPPKTPIFLVGTHSNHMDQNSMQTLSGHLNQILWTSYCDELVVNEDEDLIFFPVENSKGENDVGVQKLRIKIMAVAEGCKPTTDYNIPLSWIRIQDAIIQLREKKAARFCVTLREFPCAFGNYIHTDWSEETLKYFHEQGLIIYIPTGEELCNWVLLRPEILVDIITQLVTSSPQVTQMRGLRSDWRLLQKKGMLTKSLLVSIISSVKENEEAMIAFLEEYDLICPLTNTKVKIPSLHDAEKLQPTHFVPSLVPRSKDGCIPTWHDDQRDKKFLVFFERFLPEPLFHRLLSRAHKNSKVEFTNGATVVFRDVGKFWMSPWQPYRLKLMKKEGVIEVTFSTR